MKLSPIMIIALAALGIMVAACETAQTDPIKAEISSFEECAAAGYPIMESYPRQCKTNDGKIFVEELRVVEDGVVSKINSDKGELILSYKDNTARLSGELFRGTPCVSWKVQIITTKDMPISNVNIQIYDESKNKDVYCIQVVAEPQSIDEEIPSVSTLTNYNIELEGKIIFSGKIGDIYNPKNVVDKLCTLYANAGLVSEVRKSNDGRYYEVTQMALVDAKDVSTGKVSKVRSPVMDSQVNYYDLDGNEVASCGGLLAPQTDFCKNTVPNLKFDGEDLCLKRL